MNTLAWFTGRAISRGETLVNEGFYVAVKRDPKSGQEGEIKK